MQDKESMPFVVIVGIHRTLSSALAHVLSRLGVNMGENVNRGMEDKALMALCEEEMPFPSFKTNTTYDMRVIKLKNWLETRIGDGGMVGGKYPTLCVMLPELKEAAALLNVNLKIIHITRPLEESIKSLTTRSAKAPNQRFQASAEECELLQTYLWIKKQKFMRDNPHLTINADDLLENTEDVVGRIVKYIDIPYSDLFPTDVPSSASDVKNTTSIQNAINYIDKSRAPHTTEKPGRPWWKETTVGIKTFERQFCLDECINSFNARYPRANLVVADDSKEPVDREDCTVYKMSYDSGLSAGRNLLVSKAETEYFLNVDDDIILTDETNIQEMFDILVSSDLDIVACQINDRKFQGWFQQDDRILNIIPCETIGRSVINVDIAGNFFIAKTDSLRRTKWDNSLKVGEHTDYYLQAKEDGLKVGYVPWITVVDKMYRPGDYRNYRTRAQTMRIWSFKKWGKKLGFDEVQFHIMEKNNPMSIKW